MSTPAPKRRKLNTTSALHKPFKSPFRTPLKTQPNPPETPPSSDTLEPLSDKPEGASEQSTNPAPRPTPTRRPASTPRPLSRPFHPQFRTPHTPSSVSLTAQISELRATVHTFSQAIQLLQNPASDDNLEELIYKWRTASRAAAEELFATTRDRVNRMGGVGAWKEREKDQKKKVLEWEEDALNQDDLEDTDEDEEDEDEFDDDGRKITREQKEMQKEARKENRKVLRERRAFQMEQIQERKRMEERRVEPGSDDDSFTMDIMLKALNVDLEVIGYSKNLQQWVG